MKKPIIFSVLFFIITSISSFGQGGGDPAFNILAEEIGKNRALLDSLSQTLQPIVKPEFFLSYLENGERFGMHFLNKLLLLLPIQQRLMH